MKIEHLKAGSPDCPLIRFYDFTPAEAANLVATIHRLTTCEEQSIAMHDRPFTVALGGISLTFKFSNSDQGVTGYAPIFTCELTPKSWASMELLLAPFVEKDMRGHFQWLDDHGETSLLLSPTGAW